MIQRASFALLVLLLSSTSILAQDNGEVIHLKGRQWAPTTNGSDVPWTEANEWCEALALGGFEDWRLPSLAELKTLHDPERTGSVYIASPLPQDSCCLWSSTSTAEQQPEEGHFYVDRSGDADQYFWGFLYSDEGTEYYSVNFFPDGRALCTR